MRLQAFFGVIFLVLASAQAHASDDYQAARALMAKKKWAEAAIALRSILKDEESPQVVIDLSRALTHSGRREEALGVLSRAAEQARGARKTALTRRVRVLSRTFLTTETFQAHQQGMNSLLGKNYREARERFENALVQESNNVEILLRLGQCHVAESDYDSAAERLRLARRLNPHEMETQLWLGRALFHRGELAGAKEALALAHKSLKDSELAPVWLAEVLFALGQRKEGHKVLEADLSAHPMHLMALVTLAHSRYQTAGPRDTQMLWDARRDLQVAMSRLDTYGTGKVEGELGLDLRDPGAMRQEITTLLQKVDARINGQPIDG